MSRPGWGDRLAEVLGTRVVHTASLAGGCVGDVRALETADGRQLVAKLGSGADGALDLEGWMLDYLRAHSDVPVPRVEHAAPDLLIMERVAGSTGLAGDAQEHAAELLAALHGVTTSRYGLERDTLIGGLPQPNAWCPRWVDFFAERRLRWMAAEAYRAGRLDARTRRDVDALSERLSDWLGEPAQPALLHGDLWGGNMLSQRGRVTGLIDPAIYYGHPEVELAFGTMFGTFNERFFAAYRALRPLDPGFFAERRDLYNLYPLLVHVRLFGGSYVDDVRGVVRRFGAC
ncbi:MAG: fructosamine kinase family protein [Planctomycetota bacterium]